MLNRPDVSPAIDANQREKILSIVELSLASATRIAKVQMVAATRALQESVEIGQALSHTHSADELLALRTSLEIKGVEHVVECSKGLYDAVFESRARLIELINQSISQLSNNSPLAAAKNIPSSGSAGPRPLYDLQEYMNTSSQVVENLGKLAQQASQLTQENMESVMAVAQPFAMPSTKPASV
jgi:phasin family protein